MILPTEAVVWLSVVAAVVETKSVSTVSKILPAHLRVNDSVDDILTHPAFAGFGRLLLPWDDHRYDTTMLLRNIGSLLPYHTHVDPAIVVSSLNRMIDDASAGRTVFHDFYTDAEKQADPSREHTGLFFFRGKPDAPFAVIAPGGGFAYVASLHEGFPYAVEISNRGYKTFVLKYRVGQGGRMATEDLAASLSYILRNASSLGVATTDYSLWGSFAGARMAAAIGSHGTPPFGGSALPKPSALALLYTGHSDLASTEPPTFVAVGDADGIAPPSVMERRVAALTDEVLFGDVWRRPELSPRDRSLLTITVLIATGKPAQLAGHLGRALDNGVQPREASGLLGHLAIYCGWPSAVSALDVYDQVYTARKVDTTVLRAEGQRLPPPDSDAARANTVTDELGTVAPKFVQLTNDVVFDNLWQRSDLTLRDRSLITIAALAAMGDDDDQLDFYLGRGLESGLTSAQVTKALTHLGFYAGWPKATKAITALARSLGK